MTLPPSLPAPGDVLKIVSVTGEGEEYDVEHPERSVITEWEEVGGVPTELQEAIIALDGLTGDSVDNNNKVLITDENGNWSKLNFSQVCFLPGTKITLLNNIKINIEKLKKGDKLLSYKLDDMEPYTKSVDVLSWFSEEDTGVFSESEVTNIWSDKSPGYIIFNDNLHVTHEHLIFTKVDGEYTWLSAKEIRKGDTVFTDKGEYEEITKIEKIKEEVTVYNLRVTSSAMNYFADSYLVHNASLCDECDAKNNKL